MRLCLYCGLSCRAFMKAGLLANAEIALCLLEHRQRLWTPAWNSASAPCWIRALTLLSSPWAAALSISSVADLGSAAAAAHGYDPSSPISDGPHVTQLLEVSLTHTSDTRHCQDAEACIMLGTQSQCKRLPLPSQALALLAASLPSTLNTVG